MPTIEIVSVDSHEINLNQAEFDVAIIVENKVVSHRGLFYDFLLRQSGVIFHIGSPDLKDSMDGFFAGGGIINWDFEPAEISIPVVDEDDPTSDMGANQQFRFQFLERFKTDIDRLLKLSLASSPVSRVYFLTDYQFGSDKASQEIIYTIRDFWEQHNSGGLSFNRLYEIYSA